MILFHKTKKKKEKREGSFEGGKRLQGGDVELQLRHTCLCVYGCVYVVEGAGPCEYVSVYYFSLCARV